MKRFDGKTAIVTGASRGIGLAVAQRLIDEGANVLITARKAGPLAEVAAELHPERAAFVAGAADDPAHQDEAIATAIEKFGSLDVLVNNTGINPTYGRMIDQDHTESGAKIFAVNVISAVHWAKKAYEASLKDNGGAIVNIASVGGLRPAPMIGMYGASKAALIHVTTELALELAPQIRVNAVAPAVVKTRFAGALYEGREEEVSAAYPMKRLGVPEDIASTVAFLASADAGWITGQCITIDGGLTLTGGV